MNKLLIKTIIAFCTHSGYTNVQKQECVITFGSCVADYKENEAFEKCKVKWEKIKDDVK